MRSECSAPDPSVMRCTDLTGSGPERLADVVAVAEPALDDVRDALHIRCECSGHTASGDQPVVVEHPRRAEPVVFGIAVTVERAVPTRVEPLPLHLVDLAVTPDREHGRPPVSTPPRSVACCPTRARARRRHQGAEAPHLAARSWSAAVATTDAAYTTLLPALVGIGAGLALAAALAHGLIVSALPHSRRRTRGVRPRLRAALLAAAITATAIHLLGPAHDRHHTSCPAPRLQSRTRHHQPRR